MTRFVSVRAGFAGVVALSDHEQVIIVLPRTWAGDFSRNAKSASCEVAGMRCTLLFEGESLALDETLCARIQGTVLPADEDGRPLMRIQVAKPEDCQAATLQPLGTLGGPATSPIDAIGLLLGVAARHRDALSLSSESGSEVNFDALIGSASRNPSLLILTHLLFAEAMRCELDRFRRRYVDVEHLLPVIRGRLTARGLTAAGMPFPAPLECATDDFEVSHPTVRALAAALDAVAAGEGLRAWKGIARRSSMRLARNLRLRMCEIPSLPRPIARHHLQRQHGRHEFGTPFLASLAVAILNQRATAPDAATDASQCMMFGAELHRFWEQCVREAVSPGGTLPEPWVACGTSMRLDAATEDRRHILDAKYKFRPAGETPSTADQYQMLAYSVSEPRCERVSLVYPTHLDGAGFVETWKRRVPDGSCELRAVTTRFPSVLDLRNTRSWRAYLSGLKGELA
jgi:hypothetical protein